MIRNKKGYDLQTLFKIAYRDYLNLICFFRCAHRNGDFRLYLLWATHNAQKQPSEVYYKKGAFKNSANFTGKYLYQSLFFNKVLGLGLQLYF